MYFGGWTYFFNCGNYSTFCENLSIRLIDSGTNVHSFKFQQFLGSLAGPAGSPFWYNLYKKLDALDITKYFIELI